VVCLVAPEASEAGKDGLERQRCNRGLWQGVHCCVRRRMDLNGLKTGNNQKKVRRNDGY
jgi:hypothetical protein